MSNLLQRILMFSFFIPLIVVLIVFLPDGNHLAIQILAVLLTVGMSFEVAGIVGMYPLRNNNRINLLRGLAIVVASLIPLLARLLYNRGIFDLETTLLPFVLIILWVFFSAVILSNFREPAAFVDVLRCYLLILFYPVFGIWFFLGLPYFPLPNAILLTFLASVFLNDTAAYLGGRLFGKHSPHPFKISPNKTLAGFLSGFVISIAVCFVAWLIEPKLFPLGITGALVIGASMGVSTIIGDLFESGLKRSFGIKDSGAVILGRGGLLDSLDSLVIAAPVFYLLYRGLDSLSHL